MKEKIDKKEIKEINQHISDALKQWSDIATLADADNWSYHFEYSDEDLFNALYIFTHVAQNIAIKNGYINENNATEKIHSFKDSLKETFGFDTIELAEKVLNKYGE